MKKISMLFVLIVGLAFVFTSCENEKEVFVVPTPTTMIQKTKSKSDALLLVTFGSTWEKPHEAYHNMLKQYKAQFPDKDIYLSFTAKTCITRWAAKTQEFYYSPESWLPALGEAGYKTITVQSLHVIPGEEYIILRDEYVGDFKKEFPEVKVSLGDALLTSQEDIKTVADALMKEFKGRLEKGEALVFMGHGNPKKEFIEGFDGKPHGVNQCYYDIERDMRAYEGGKYADKIFVGTVDYAPTLFEPTLKIINGKMNKQGIINLFPLMSIAGDHANNDMAGNEEDSWKMGLKKAGYTINDNNLILKGLAEYPDILNVWIEHTKKAAAELK